MPTYTTHGSVCGGCDHAHKTLRTAQDCADKHHAAIQRRNVGNAYSDRCVVHADGSPLTADEREELFYLQHEA